jgi:hypothetical protein
VLVGEWGTQVLFPGPGVIAIIGGGPDGSLTQSYFDNRGVHRIYQMTLDGRVWKTRIP